MTDRAPTEEGTRSPSQGGRIEEICDRFEAAWKTGRPPPLEDYLALAPGADQTALLRELLELELNYRRQHGERPTPEEYQRRFPHHVAVIETILDPAPPARAVGPRPGADHNLLVGLLALQNNFIDRDTLVAGFAAWVADKSRDLGRFLLESGALDAETHAVLEALARKHLQMHGGDLEKSLSAVSAPGSLRDDLERIDDVELQTCLTRVRENHDRADSDGTVMHSHAADRSAFAGGRFHILRLYKTGGLGAVYVAHDEELHREVALKEIRGGHAHDPDSRARFLQEAEITGRLEHPGIIPVYGLGTHADGRPFYAMRFIKGDTLSDAIARFHGPDALRHNPGERSLALRELLGRFVAVCNAMAYAHSRGILHRDLKPSNILLGPYGETLLVDWGLAKPVGRPEAPVRAEEQTLRPHSSGSGSTTLPGDTPGTPAYMSPEQAAGDLDRLGLPSDVYSLGATLYCLLTGKPPFEDRDINLVLDKVRRGEFPPPRAVNRTIDPALEAVCLKAMAVKPEERYETVEALKAELERWLAGEPVSAWREPFSIRTRRWMRRNRTAVSSAAAALVVLVGALATFSVEQSRTNSALIATNVELNQANKKAELALDAAGKAKRATEQALAEKGEALAQSESSGKRAEAVLAFLKDDVLAINRPKGQDGGLGVDVTVREAVDAAEPRIAERLKPQPIVEADIRNTLGVTYLHLGEAKLAIPQLERAVELRRGELGPDHRDTLSSRSDLGMAYLNDGRTPEAIKMLEQTIKLFDSTLGPVDPDTLGSRNNLAEAYQLVGRHGEAIEMLEAILKQRVSKFGPDDPDTLISRNSLAAAHLGARHDEVAIGMLAAILEQRESKLGFDHPDTLTTRNDLAEACKGVGRLDQAIKLHEANRKLYVSNRGPDHPYTLISSMNLGDAYRRADRLEDALPLLKATLKTQESKLGLEHSNTVDTVHKLAHALKDSKPLEAEPLFRRAIEGYGKVQGPDGPLTIDVTYDLADLLDKTDRAREAEQLFRVALEQGRKRFGLSDPRNAPAMASLGWNLLKQRKWVEAEEILRECLAIREKAQPDDWRTFSSRSQLGGSLLGQNKFAEAEPLILSGYEDMKAREAKIAASAKLRLTEAADRIVQLYDAWGHKEKADEWRKKLGDNSVIGKPAKP